MTKLDTQYCRNLAELVDACLIEKKLARKELIRPGLAKATLENFFSGTATLKTIKKIELVLNRRFVEPDGKADSEHGGYTSEEARDHTGRFLFIRPFFTQPIISTYLIDLRWSDTENCLTFEEKGRADSKFSQKGEVCFAKDHPFLHLLTVADGNVRNILLSFPPNDDPYYRGIILSLAKPTSLSWIPACAPVAMRLLAKDEGIEVGDYKPSDKSYDEYKRVLESIEGDYALLRSIGK